MENQILTKQQQKLLTPQGFIDQFFNLCAMMAPPLAYLATERQYSAITGTNRYSTYKSFKTAKNKILRSQLKKGN